MRRRLGLTALFGFVLLAMVLDLYLTRGNVPFRTIAAGEAWGFSSDQSAAALIVIPDYQRAALEVDRLRLPDDVAQHILAMDYVDEFALYVYLGQQATLDDRIDVQRVIFRDNTLFVYADVIKPARGHIVRPALVYAYALIEVAKDPDLTGDVDFELSYNSVVVATSSAVFSP